MGEDFSRQTRRFSAAILTDCKGNRRSMTGKRPARRRAAVVNTGSDIPAGLWYNESGYRQKIPLPLRRFRHRKPSHWDAVRGLCQQQSPPFQNGGDCSLLLPFQVQQGRRTPKKIRKKVSKNVSESILQIRRVPAIIDLKNKNAAACGCCSTRKPVQVLALPTQRRTRTAWIIIRQTAFSRKCRFAFIVLRSAGRKTPLHALCRLRTCMAFLFFARRPGAHSPPGPLR